MENDKRNETFVYNNDYNNDGLDIYSNTTNVIQDNNDNVNAACNYTNNFVMSPVLHATAPMTPFAVTHGHVDLTTQSYPTSSNEAQYSYVDEQIPIQNPPRSVMDTSSSLPDNSFNMTFNSPQMPTNDSEIFRFAIPGFQIIVIPTFSPFANLSNFDLQCQFQQDQAFSSISPNQEQSYISGGSSDNVHNYQSQHRHYQN